SSWVGPSPPLLSTSPARPAATRKAATLSARSSATLVCQPTGMPTSARRRLSHWLLVSRFWPLVISLPMEMISAFMGGPRGAPPRGRAHPPPSRSPGPPAEAKGRPAPQGPPPPGKRRPPAMRAVLPVLITPVLFLAPATPGEDPPRKVAVRKTEVSIRGDAFLINGKPTYAGRKWQGQRIEGLLFNARMVQGIFDDLNPKTRDNWAYPDTGRWDPERNTREFVAAMPQWR